MYEPVRTGDSRSLFWIPDNQGRFVGKTYFQALSSRERAAFDALFNRLAAQDVIGEERICVERGPLWRLAAARHHLVFFHAAENLMLCSGYLRGAGRSRREDALALAQQCHDYFYEGTRGRHEWHE